MNKLASLERNICQKLKAEYHMCQLLSKMQYICTGICLTLLNENKFKDWCFSFADMIFCQTMNISTIIHAIF